MPLKARTYARAACFATQQSTPVQAQGGPGQGGQAHANNHDTGAALGVCAVTSGRAVEHKNVYIKIKSIFMFF